MRILSFAIAILFVIAAKSQNDFISYDSVMVKLNQDYYTGDLNYKNPIVKKPAGWYVVSYKTQSESLFWSYNDKGFKEVPLKSKKSKRTVYVQADTFNLMTHYGYNGWHEDVYASLKDKPNLSQKESLSLGIALLCKSKSVINIVTGIKYIPQSAFSTTSFEAEKVKAYQRLTDSAFSILSKVENGQVGAVSTSYLMDYEQMFRFLTLKTTLSEKKLLKTLSDNLFTTFNGYLVKKSMESCQENSILFLDTEYDYLAALYFQKKKKVKLSLILVLRNELNNIDYLSMLEKQYPKQFKLDLSFTKLEIDKLKDKRVNKKYSSIKINLPELVSQFRVKVNYDSYSSSSIEANEVILNNGYGVNLNYSIKIRDIIEMEIVNGAEERNIYYTSKSIFKQKNLEDLVYVYKLVPKTKSYGYAFEESRLLNGFKEYDYVFNNEASTADKIKLKRLYESYHRVAKSLKESNKLEDLSAIVDVNLKYLSGSLMKNDRDAYNTLTYLTLVNRKKEALKILDGLLLEYTKQKVINSYAKSPPEYTLMNLSKQFGLVEVEDLLFKYKIYYQSYFIPFRVGNKHGFENRNHTELIPPIYDKVKEYRSKKSEVSINGKTGFIDFENEYVVPPEYDEILKYSNSYDKVFIVKLNEKFGVINKDNKILIPIAYDLLTQYPGYKFTNYITVEKDGKKGMFFLDNNKGYYPKKIVPEEYDDILFKQENSKSFYIVAMKGTSVNYYNNNGKKLDPEIFSEKARRPPAPVGEGDVIMIDMENERIDMVEEEEGVMVEEIFEFVEQQPEFPGGVTKMYEYLAKEIKYPDLAKEAGIQGKVYVKFVITKTGKIGEVKVVRGVNKLLDAEAIRVIKKMPNWTPGEQRGKKQDVWYTLPIKFALDDKK